MGCEFRGSRPQRASRLTTRNVPKPLSTTFLSIRRPLVTAAARASMIRADSCLVRPSRSATSMVNCCLFNAYLSRLGSVVYRFSGTYQGEWHFCLATPHRCAKAALGDKCAMAAGDVRDEADENRSTHSADRWSRHPRKASKHTHYSVDVWCEEFSILKPS